LFRKPEELTKGAADYVLEATQRAVQTTSDAILSGPGGEEIFPSGKGILAELSEVDSVGSSTQRMILGVQSELNALSSAVTEVHHAEEFVSENPSPVDESHDDSSREISYPSDADEIFDDEEDGDDGEEKMSLSAASSSDSPSQDSDAEANDSTEEKLRRTWEAHPLRSWFAGDFAKEFDDDEDDEYREDGEEEASDDTISNSFVVLPEVDDEKEEDEEDEEPSKPSVPQTPESESQVSCSPSTTSKSEGEVDNSSESTAASHSLQIPARDTTKAADDMMRAAQLLDTMDAMEGVQPPARNKRKYSCLSNWAVGATAVVAVAALMYSKFDLADFSGL
jgi:hypothetical protein